MSKAVAILIAVVAIQTTYIAVQTTHSFMARSQSADGQSQSVDVRSQYRETEVADFIKGNKINENNMHPRSLVGQLFSYPVSLEGRQQEEIVIKYRNNRSEDLTVIEYTAIGLPDDSVRSKRTRIEMKQQQGNWGIVWVGYQVQCQSDRGHQDWSGERCS